MKTKTTARQVTEMAAEMGLPETARRLGISRSRVDQIVNRRKSQRGVKES